MLEFSDWQRCSHTRQSCFKPSLALNPHRKSLFLSCHIQPPLIGNLIIDGWKRCVEWQESCRLLSFKGICHLAGGGTNERQLSWILNRQERRVGWRWQRQESKSKIWMIDRHWKWRWDSHLFLIMPVATMCYISRWLVSGFVQCKVWEWKV